MTPGAATDLYDLCREYLDACADAVKLGPGGDISRVYVSPGAPAWDCPEQLTVHAGGPIPGDTLPLSPPLQPAHRIAGGDLVNMIAMTATVLRCVPGIQGTKLPTASQLEDAAKNTLGDVWAIWNHIATLKRADQLWAPKTREVMFSPAVSLLTQGGVAGWQLEVRVQLGGYRTQ